MNDEADFKQDLFIGQEWEDRFVKCPIFNNKLQKLPGKKSDFVLLTNNLTLQLKTEVGYVLDKTNPFIGKPYSEDKGKLIRYSENFFIERWSREGVIGGPWQSISHNTDYYAHLFPWDKILFTWKTVSLVECLDSMIERKILKDEKLIKIYNKGYITYGWPINRLMLGENVKTIKTTLDIPSSPC